MGGEQRGFGVDYYIESEGRRYRLESHRLAKPASHAIALHCTAEYFSDGQANAKLRKRLWLPFDAFSAQIKNRHMGCEMPSPLLVDAIKIRMPQ